MKEYDHKKIEKKWQTIWEKKKIYQAKGSSKKPKFYGLIEFPYPSGSGLHVGHIRSNTAMDIISRKRRMEGFNVLYPIGWDAFGLPTENYAIKTGIQPSIVTKKNTDIFRKQLKAIGFSFDWSREINTTDPKYYKWTQWIFLQFLKKGLAYKAKMTINWCPKDKIGLANEEVVDGCCERCGTPVEKREKEQWMLAITKYADRLYKDLDEVNYLEKIKIQQRNWIGKSEGADIEFCLTPSPSPLVNGEGGRRTGEVIKVFTTRPDTIFGATYLVLAPEHELVQKLKSQISNWNEVSQYILETKAKKEIDRTTENKIKTGIELKGIKAINPANTQALPVWIADYVLPHYGTGAIMAVPAHDERDFEFAKKYGLEIKNVIEPKFVKMGEEGSPKPDLPFVKREAVCAIVRNPKNNTYLCISWKNFLMHGLVTGGMEPGENVVETARREVLEETGYKNLKLVSVSPILINTFFYHRQKKENRWAHFRFAFFELENEEQGPVAEEESSRHEILWKKKEELKDFFSVFEGNFLVTLLNNIDYVYTGAGILSNSGKFNSVDSEQSKKEIIKFVGGKEKTTFKLRDWIFSRQRYWGEPIPVVHCEKCGIVPVPEKDLPVELPKVKNYQPTDSGESPLANISKWVNTKCPKCKGKAKRETDTMPNWAGSSWYYLRYVDPKNNKEFAGKKNLSYWLGVDPVRSRPPEHGIATVTLGRPASNGVDWYNGGNEHTTLHLLYSRFWHKFLFDQGLVPTNEPYMKRTSHGMILGEGGVKMSKSLGNIINPDDIVKIYGADTLRIYEMFMGPFDQSVAWSTESIIGSRRFIEKVWRIGGKVTSSAESSFAGSLSPLASGALPLGSSACETPRQENSAMLVKLLHRTIKKVSEDIEEMRFNTAISSLMILATEMEKAEDLTAESYKLFLQILSPFAPHVTEELWQRLYPHPTSPLSRGRSKEGVSIHLSSWPKWDENLMKDEKVKIMIQINGKVRGEIMVSNETSEEKVKKQVLAEEIVLKNLIGKEVKKVIYVKNRLINIVV